MSSREVILNPQWHHLHSFCHFIQGLLIYFDIKLPKDAAAGGPVPGAIRKIVPHNFVCVPP